MRKIKFRAWNKKNKRYYKVTTIAFDNESLTLVGMDGAVLFGVPFDDVILEQYTGLNDKNYVEIYEGDIVLFDKNHENNHQEKILIDFISGKKTPCFEIVYSNNLTAFRKSLIFPPEERANHKYETTIHNGDIVVGNIHENGDLIKWRYFVNTRK